MPCHVLRRLRAPVALEDFPAEIVRRRLTFLPFEHLIKRALHRVALADFVRYAIFGELLLDAGRQANGNGHCGIVIQITGICNTSASESGSGQIDNSCIRDAVLSFGELFMRSA